MGCHVVLYRNVTSIHIEARNFVPSARKSTPFRSIETLRVTMRWIRLLRGESDAVVDKRSHPIAVYSLAESKNYEVEGTIERHSTMESYSGNNI